MVRDPELEELARDCRIEFYKASGPGGQHRNKVETAVRIVHVPTGVRAQASERRSRERNRTEALMRLAAALERRSRKKTPRVPTRKSAAVRETELEGKRRAARRKSERRPQSPEE
jgi:protein subunit release factor B